MKRLVVDASVAFAWHLKDETNKYADDVLAVLGEAQVVVPAHWLLELSNAFLVAERKGRCSAGEANRAISLLKAIPTAFDDRTYEQVVETMVLARAHRLTVYDAAYLELAIRARAGLCSLDTDPKRAAEAEQVACFAPE